MLDFAEKNMYIMGAVAIGLAVPQVNFTVVGLLGDANFYPNISDDQSHFVNNMLC